MEQLDTQPQQTLEQQNLLARYARRTLAVGASVMAFAAPAPAEASISRLPSSYHLQDGPSHVDPPQGVTELDFGWMATADPQVAIRGKKTTITHEFSGDNVDHLKITLLGLSKGLKFMPDASSRHSTDENGKPVWTFNNLHSMDDPTRKDRMALRTSRNAKLGSRVCALIDIDATTDSTDPMIQHEQETRQLWCLKVFKKLPRAVRSKDTPRVTTRAIKY